MTDIGIEINAAFTLFGQIVACIALIVGFVQGYKYLFGLTPTAKLEARVSAMETKLKNDYALLTTHSTRLDALDDEIKRTNDAINKIDEGIQQLGKSQISVLNHLITGNGVEAMRKDANDLTNYFIKR